MSRDAQVECEHATCLRLELKKWERAFIAANQGRKPGRDDIRNDAVIAAKYKEYRTLQRASDGPQLKHTPRKRKQTKDAGGVLAEAHPNRVSSTPKKTPSKAKQVSLQLVTSSPSEDVEPTPAFIRRALGPTPQKDGQVLGIFDMPLTGTPSKTDTVTRPVVGPAVGHTPSKPAPASSEPAFSKTPQSSGKRFFLDAFAGTPLKRKRDEDSGTPSTAKRRFATPSFLRRSFPLAPIAEDAGDGLQMAPPFRKRGLVRSLSSIIQGLRKQEQERMDDDWDILNELEQEERGETEKEAEPSVAVPDSQGVEMPLGPDQATVVEEEDVAPHEPGIIRKPWKKKGLKRQTRRVIMRPVVNKAGKAQDELSEDDGSGLETIAETQDVNASAPPQMVEDRNGDGSDDDDSELDGEEPPQKHVTAAKVTKSDEKTTEKRKPRKVSAQAHANFRKLKIKNKNSKAGGRGKKFGRR